MAPKQNKNAPVAIPDNEAEVDREDAVIDALEALFDRVNLYIEESHLQSCAIDRAVDSCLDSTLCIVEMAYVAREEQPLHELAIQNGSWEPDSEPEPCAVDTWIRGAIPFDTKPRVDQAFNKWANHRTSPTRASAVPGDSRVGSPLIIPGPQSDAGKTTPSKVTGPRLRQTKPQSPKTTELETRLREEIANRRRQAQVTERTKKQDDEAKHKLDMLKKELRGKDYTYDHRAKMVLLNKVNPSKLPSATTEPNVSLLDFNDLDDAEEDGKKSAKKSSKPKEDEVKRLTAGKKAVKGRKTAPDFVEKPSEAQPSCLETMRMSRGVTLKQGGATKAGPARLAMPGQMNKAEYSRHIDRQKTRGGWEKLSNALQMKEVVGGKKAESVSFESEAQKSQSPSHQTASEATTKTPHPKNIEVGQLNKQNRPAGEPPSWILDGRPKTEAEPVVIKGAINVDLYLANQPDWGTAGAPRGDFVPSDVAINKPTVKDFKKTIGRANRLPRTRAAQATIAPPVKRQAPVPKSIRQRG
ncbi:hypothetical protein BSKO_09712 [Bryopsis sp. KO-2023]|nr:hypothetical protein BSKO_09712 [Bryopsis sp. KO-2023]